MPVEVTRQMVSRDVCKVTDKAAVRHRLTTSGTQLRQSARMVRHVPTICLVRS